MKPLRWFGYKIDDDKVWSTINDALKPFEIFLQELDLNIKDYSYSKTDDFGVRILIKRSCKRSFFLTLRATENGYLKLKNFMRNDCGAKMLIPVEISFGEFPFLLKFETWNDLDSIENFLRLNNDHHQQSPHRSRDY